MDREADVADFAFLLRGLHGLHRTARSEDFVQLSHFGEGVELVEVHVIGLEELQGIFQLFAATVAGAVFGLAGEEDAVAIGGEGRAEALLRIAVAGGDVEVIDAAVHGFGDDVGGSAGGLIHDDDAAKADDRELLAGFAQLAAGDGMGGGGV